MGRVAVVGQVGRDLVLTVDALPDGGGASDVRSRRELLGGKGANQAVGCRLLGHEAALVAVVGDDQAGAMVLDEARSDGIAVDAVARRGTTALLVDLVEDDGTRRLLEHVPGEALLTPDDVRAAGEMLARADAVLLQLQQPGDAVLEVLRIARAAGVRVVADGAPEDDDVRDALLGGAHVLRADAAEAALLLGDEPSGVDATLEAARELQGRGPAVVALAAGTEANVVAWDGGYVVMPLLDAGPAVDPTGGGDAFVAGLTAALLRGEPAEVAAWWGSAAAALTVTHPGGRPDYDTGSVEALAARARGAR